MSVPSMVPVASSNIQAIGYDAQKQELHVQFGSGLYVYEKVPPETFDGLLRSDSKGKFLHANIRQHHKARKV